MGGSEGRQRGPGSRADKVRGEGVDERVSGQASAAVGATVGLYHIIRLHASRGVRNEETFWKRDGSLEGAWKELRAQAGARGRSSTQSTRPAPLRDLRVGARLRSEGPGCTVQRLMAAGLESEAMPRLRRRARTTRRVLAGDSRPRQTARWHGAMGREAQECGGRRASTAPERGRRAHRAHETALQGAGTWMTHCGQACPGVLADASDMHPQRRGAASQTARVARELLDDAPQPVLAPQRRGVLTGAKHHARLDELRFAEGAREGRARSSWRGRRRPDKGHGTLHPAVVPR
jgi:hypothetical protein